MEEKRLITKLTNILNDLFSHYQKQLTAKKIGALVSGGIDSSLIAYFTSKFFKNPTLFTLQSKEGLDLFYVKTLNQKLKEKLVVVNFAQQEVDLVKPEVIKILEKIKLPINPTQISLACAFFLLLKKAKEEGIEVIFTGQGPDILLAGYHQYKNVSLIDLNEKIKNDLPLLETDKKRDQAVADHFGIRLINPYLEKEFIDFALLLKPKYKINKINDEIYEKYLLRKVGETFKLPKEIYLRHKKALQYSTRMRKYV
jgi:asparagine synthase (glutamine-hydrolysing)